MDKNKDKLNEVLKEYDINEIIDACGIDSILEEVRPSKIINHYGYSSLMDEMWDSDIERYYKDNVAVDMDDYIKGDDYEITPMERLISFCQSVRGDEVDVGYHTFQIKEILNDFINNLPERHWEI